MDTEVEAPVLAVINEKRLRGDKRTPSEVISRMGVAGAREKASEHAWLATGDLVIAAIWAELVHLGHEGRRWFAIESLDPELRLGGGERSTQQVQRAKDRIRLLKRAHDAAQDFRAVLQTNRIHIAKLESDKDAKVSMRVPDDEAWHVAEWDAARNTALLVRGPRGWLPTPEERQAALARRDVLVPPPFKAPPVHASPEELQAAAIGHLTRHFAGYGYPTENVTAQNLGYDIAVSDKKGATLLQLAVRGTSADHAGFALSAQERACAERADTWRLAVVADAAGAAPQHKLYRRSELGSATGLGADPAP